MLLKMVNCSIIVWCGVVREISLTELSKPEIDMAILGQLAALHRREATIEAVSDTNRKKKRRVCARSYTVLRFGDIVICKNTFIFLHAISLKHFKNLCSHFDSNVSAIKLF